MTAKDHKYKTVRPDSKGRITLGNLAEGVSSYIVSQDEHSRIILEPLVEIPASEKWLYENKTSLKKNKKSLKDSADDRVKSRGSLTKE
jgi:hypothetical protein